MSEITPIRLRHQISEMAVAWIKNKDYIIPQRRDKLKALLLAYKVANIGALNDGDLLNFRKDLDNVICGFDEGQVVS